MAVTDVLDDGDEIESIMRKYYPLIAESAFLDAQNAGVGIEFDLANEYVQSTIDRLAKNVRNVAETTRDEIRSLIDRQTADGVDLQEIARAIGDMADIRSQSRGMTIARTELGMAYNMASMTSYRMGGVEKVEVVDGDDDDICSAANGSIWTLEQAEENPLGHPNCTRFFIPIVE